MDYFAEYLPEVGLVMFGVVLGWWLSNGREYSCTVTPVTLLGTFPESNKVLVTLPDILFRDGFESE